MLARQSKQMTHLIDDLLDISRISRGSVRLRIERIDLVDLIRQVADEHRATFEGGCTLELSLPESLPIDGDSTRLRQIFGNLAHNAYKFTNPGGQITIAAHVDRERQMAHVAIRDTGVGMNEEFLAQLFEPFRQDEASVNRSRGGLGLGLALVKGLVELHGGAVTAHSSGLGRGSEFTVSLPLAKGEDTLCNGSDAAARTSNRPTYRILLVEDSQPVAEIFSLILKQMGHQHVEIAPNAVEALDRIPVFRPQIVFSDISMPGMSGYELAQRIRQHPEWNHVVLVAVTGLGQPDDCQQARHAGFDYHLVKPADVVQIELLFDEIANQVQG
jgi:CheY-like chemotaxis protein